MVLTKTANHFQVLKECLICDVFGIGTLIFVMIDTRLITNPLPLLWYSEFETLQTIEIVVGRFGIVSFCENVSRDLDQSCLERQNRKPKYTYDKPSSIILTTSTLSTILCSSLQCWFLLKPTRSQGGIKPNRTQLMISSSWFLRVDQSKLIHLTATIRTWNCFVIVVIFCYF